MLRWWLVAALCGCGRLHFDAVTGGGVDAAPDGTSGDGGSDAALLGPFSSPSSVTELNLAGVNTEDPSLTDDLLEIIVSSTRPTGMGGVDLWTAMRATPTDTWGALTLVPTVNSTSDDTTPEVSGDGLALVFASSRPGGAGQYDLYQSTRPTRGAAWSAPVPIAELSTPDQEFAGGMTANARTIVFSSSRAGGAGGGDLYEATRPVAGAAWGAPTLIADVVSSDDDSAPSLSGDGRTLIFSSARAGGMGDQDVWIATRAAIGSPWSPPITIPELNHSGYDSDPWLSADGRTLFYARQMGALRSVFTAAR